MAEIVKDKNGFSTNAYLTESLRCLRKAKELSPEITELIDSVIAEIEVVKPNYKIVRGISATVKAERDALKQTQKAARIQEKADRDAKKAADRLARREATKGKGKKLNKVEAAVTSEADEVSEY